MEFKLSNRCLIRFTLLLLISGSVNNLQAQDSTRRWWVPDHLKLQYAGGIGFFAVGAGYESKGRKTETDIYYGFLPEWIGGEDLHSATVKFTWYPLGEKEWKKWKVKPLAVGALINYSFGRQYYSFDPRNYPFNYYRIPTSLNTGIIIGGQAGRYGESTGAALGHWSLYYEIVSFDRELVSYIQNMRALSITDILTLGVGIKYSF